MRKTCTNIFSYHMTYTKSDVLNLVTLTPYVTLSACRVHLARSSTDKTVFHTALRNTMSPFRVHIACGSVFIKMAESTASVALAALCLVLVALCHNHQ